MTPYSHHINNSYLDAYLSDLASDLTEAHKRSTVAHTMRNAVARVLVRVGVWMVHDEQALATDTIVVLPRQADHSRIRDAA